MEFLWEFLVLCFVLKMLRAAGVYFFKGIVMDWSGAERTHRVALTADL
jgi:hypothetical protein